MCLCELLQNLLHGPKLPVAKRRQRKTFFRLPSMGRFDTILELELSLLTVQSTRTVADRGVVRPPRTFLRIQARGGPWACFTHGSRKVTTSRTVLPMSLLVLRGVVNVRKVDKLCRNCQIQPGSVTMSVHGEQVNHSSQAKSARAARMRCQVPGPFPRVADCLPSKSAKGWFVSPFLKP